MCGALAGKGGCPDVFSVLFARGPDNTCWLRVSIRAGRVSEKTYGHWQRSPMSRR